MTISKEALLDLHERTTVEGKRQMVAKKGRYDTQPKITVAFEDGCLYAGMPQRGVYEGIERAEDDPQWWIGSVAAASVYAQWIEHGKTPIKSVAFITEGHALIGESFADDYEHGDLAKHFRDNPDSNVSEVITTYHFDWDDGEWRLSGALSPYHYTDGGLIEFGEPIYFPPDESEGRIYDHFVAMLKETRP